MATFGRLLDGKPDTLEEFVESPLLIEDEHVIAISGKSQHTIGRFTGRKSDILVGTVYSVSLDEILRADDYEVAPCERVSVVLRSGTRAWVYIDGRYGPTKSDG